jgi:hypothetical protein
LHQIALHLKLSLKQLNLKYQLQVEFVNGLLQLMHKDVVEFHKIVAHSHYAELQMKFFGNAHKIVNHLVKEKLAEIVVQCVNQQNANVHQAFYVQVLDNVFHVLHALLHKIQLQHAILVKFLFDKTVIALHVNVLAMVK